MELQEFCFVYEDLKEQLKQLPSLPLLLKSVEKTTKKLDCLNLYSLVDRREFDFELFQQQTFEEISLLLKNVTGLSQKSNESSINMEQLLDLEQKLEVIKQQKIEAFDKLSKTEQVIQQQIDILVDQTLFHQPPRVDNQIKQVEQDEEQPGEEQIYNQSSDGNRIEKLKKEIDDINMKIMKINRGKGKWFDGDHRDFIKIYTRCRGDASKVVEQGQKILGMKNIQIMDHLEVYQTYLQLEKEKKLASQEYKNIKFLQQQTKIEKQTQVRLVKEQKSKIKSKIKEEQNIIKKQQIQQFKRKKAEERDKIIQIVEKQKQTEKKVNRLSVEKKKQIAARNMKLIEQKHEQFKQRNNAKALNSSKNKPKPTTILANQQSNSIKPKLPKPPQQSKKQ